MLEDINNASTTSEKDVILLNLITFLEAPDAVDAELGLDRVKEAHHVDSHHHHHKESPSSKGCAKRRSNKEYAT